MSQQRTAKARYSEEFLVAVKHLLSVEDPVSEARYHTRMHDITAEPAETLARARHNARVAVENCRTGEHGPVIADDFLFIELELKFQRIEMGRLRTNLRRGYWTAAAGGFALFAGMGFAIFADNAPARSAATVLVAATIGAGALLLLIGIAVSARQWVGRRKASRWLLEIDQAMRRRSELE